MRKVPLKNYFILTLILVLSIFIVFYLVKIYNSTMHNTNDKQILNKIKEITILELDNYIVENPNIVIYLMDSDYKSISFEKKLNQVIVEHDLQSQFVLINIANNIYQEYDKTANVNFKNKSILKEVPINSLVIIENKKIKRFIKINDGLKKSEISKFLKENEVY